MIDAWEKLKDGIHFENSEVFLPWNTSLMKIKSIGNPVIVRNGGRTEIAWKNKSLLNGLKGDWYTYYLGHEFFKNFCSIKLSIVGDDESFIAYENMKTHLLTNLNNPSLQKDENDEKEIKWIENGISIFLYLFEMHSYHCTLTISKE